jgi:hypothetical protein
MSYKIIALNAAKIAEEKLNPEIAWKKCAKNEYPSSETRETKTCPKNTF